MKIKFFKFFFIFSLLITPLIFSAYNVYAVKDYIIVEESKINLSPTHISHLNLNTPEIKKYLIKRIEFSEALPEDIINEIKQKENCICFFTMKKNLFNYRGDILLYIWMPFNTKQPNGIGTLQMLPLTYETRTRSCTL